MTHKFSLILTFPFFICVSSFCQEVKSEKKNIFEFSGYLKDLQSVLFIEKVDSNFSTNLIHNRLNLKINCSNRLNVRFELRNRIFYGEQIKLTPGFGKLIDQNNNVYKLSYLWVDEKSFVIHSVIDRFMVRYTLKKWDVKC